MRLLLTLLGTGLLIVGMPGQASAQRQQLKLPFRAGTVQINFDETYFGTQPHPTNGAIAFDMSVRPPEPNVEILAIGDGQVRLGCTHKSGASILVFEADGYPSPFVYVHLEAASLPAWMSTGFTRVKQGDVLGRMFPSRIDGKVGEACLQFSTGPHLHIDMPELGIVMDGVAYTEAFPNDFDLVESTNGLAPRPATATCNGIQATVIGTSGNDRLVGTNGPDVFAGLQGDDEIIGLGGDDIICGGKGNDLLIGGEGFDVIYGAQGNDTIYGANGNDANQRQDVKGGRYFGGAGNDWIYGTNRWDRMQGGPGSDSMFGFTGRDWMRGGANNDRLDGGGGIDDMNAGNGNDDLVVGSGDLVRGGAGNQDRCNLSGGQPAQLISCELRF